MVTYRSDYGNTPALSMALATVLLVVLGAVLSGCAGASGEAGGSVTEMFGGFGQNDLKARQHGPGGVYGTVGTTRAGAQVYPGSSARGAGGVAPAGSGGGNGGGEGDGGQGDPDVEGIQASPDGDGYQMNFEDAEVAAVVKSILGDILQANYAIDPRVTGTLNLSSARPVPRANLVKVLETALKALNVSVVKEAGVYRITPSSEAVGSGPVDFGGAGEGYGTSVIPVKYVSAQTIMRVLESFASRPGSLKVDPSTNYVVTQGTAAERRAVIDAAALIDVDWMKEQSVGIYPLANSAPETIITELGRILDTGEGGVSQGQAQFQPMSRLNAVLVVAKRRDVVDKVGTWIRRLDRADQSTGVKVYRLKYAQAKNVAAMLNDIYGSGGSGVGTKDTDALEPGSGSKTGSSFGTSSPGSGSGISGGGLGSSSGSGFGSSSGSGSGSSAGRISSGFNAFGGGSGDAGGGGGLDAPTSGGGDAFAGGAAKTPSSSAGGGGGRKGIRVTPDVSNNSLLILAGPAEYREIERTIQQLDRAPVQVTIEATIAEVKLNDQLRYGTQFFLKSADFGFDYPGSVGFGRTRPLKPVGGEGFNLLVGKASDPRFVLDALKRYTNVKILSSPQLVVLDNQIATLQVGDQVPITTRSATSVENPLAPTVNSVEFRDTGIILRVLPRVNANGVVTLDVEQEISNVANKDSNTLTPTIQQRRVRSQIAVASGQTVLLGGLISERQEKARSGIPGLIDIKFLGDILSLNDNTADRNELIIFIKPQIMRDAMDSQRVAEELRARMYNIQRPLPAPR
jgi:general secretion pathway protein D